MLEETTEKRRWTPALTVRQMVGNSTTVVWLGVLKKDAGPRIQICQEQAVKCKWDRETNIWRAILLRIRLYTAFYWKAGLLQYW